VRGHPTPQGRGLPPRLRGGSARRRAGSTQRGIRAGSPRPPSSKSPARRTRQTDKDSRTAGLPRRKVGKTGNGLAASHPAPWHAVARSLRRLSGRTPPPRPPRVGSRVGRGGGCQHPPRGLPTARALRPDPLLSPPVTGPSTKPPPHRRAQPRALSTAGRRLRGGMPPPPRFRGTSPPPDGDPRRGSTSTTAPTGKAESKKHDLLEIEKPDFPHGWELGQRPRQAPDWPGD